jgi:MtfA peptidase
LLAQPEPANLREYLRSHVWQWSYLPDDTEDKALDWLRIFLAEKYWEGCNGFELKPEHQWTVAAQASLMTIAFPQWYFDSCKTLLIYPGDYVAESVSYMVDGQTGLHGQQARSGQATYRGPVILNWPAIHEAAFDDNDGHSLTIHELAHVLDFDNGPGADGVPPLPPTVDAARWKREFENQLTELREWIERGYSVLVDDYGLSSLTELFAVSSELYFQKPHDLGRYHPELFDLLLECYQVDWRTWLP